MPNITLYISKENTESLAKEPNKSGLINQLLEAHYTHSLQPVKSISIADDTTKWAVPDLTTPEDTEVSSLAEIPHIQDIMSKLAKVPGVKLCKKGHAYKGSKCLQKGCL